jgi:hypothetical protein
VRTLILSFDWNATLFWWDEQGQDAVDENSLPISNGLRRDLDDCYSWFSEMFFAEDSKPTLMDQRLFDTRAFELWERLRTELKSECHVLFYSQEFACNFNSPGDFKAARRVASAGC